MSIDITSYLLGKQAGGGGGDEPTGTVNITSNGNHNVKQYATASVAVPNSYSASDEGKVVSSGALVSQTSQSISQNGTYDTTLKNEVVVNVSGGGSDKFIKYDWDFKTSMVDSISGVEVTTIDAPQTSDGLTFDRVSSYAKIPWWIKEQSYNTRPTTIEVDVGAMDLQNTTDHQRFIMATDSTGFIYRNTGAWSLYGTFWATDSNITDPNFFANSTVKVVIDENNYWHIYKDNVLVYEPNQKLYLGMGTSTNQYLIGSNSQSIYNITIEGLRITMQGAL